MGKIPLDDEMPDDLFNKYDELIQSLFDNNAEPLNREETESLMKLFSDDYSDLNTGLVHSLEYNLCSIDEFIDIILTFGNEEYKKSMLYRQKNGLKNCGFENEEHMKSLMIKICSALKDDN
ncbi:MAG: hypothetical protein K2J40_05250 [Ruminococcus sp.]|nr:hypothetical protein [Ruminococcus sp.]